MLVGMPWRIICEEASFGLLLLCQRAFHMYAAVYTALTPEAESSSGNGGSSPTPVFPCSFEQQLLAATCLVDWAGL